MRRPSIASGPVVIAIAALLLFTTGSLTPGTFAGRGSAAGPAATQGPSKSVPSCSAERAVGCPSPMGVARPEVSPNASANWTAVNTSISPAGRNGAAMEYDPALKEVVLFGGVDSSWNPFDDTWTYAAGVWTNVTGSVGTAPAARWEPQMTYDGADGYLVLFGGRNDTTFFNDTWTFNASGWHPLSTPVAPSPRGLGDFAFDPADGYAVLFSGGSGNLPAGSGSPWTTVQDTWKFAGGSWTNLTATSGPSPPGTQAGGMVYDAADGYLLAYGGGSGSSAMGACNLRSPVMFSFHQGSWTNRTASNGTPQPGGNIGYQDFGMAYDPSLGSVVTFGGETAVNGSCGSIAETWLFSSGTWTNWTSRLNASAPSAREWFPMTYDGSDGYLLLHGGNPYGMPVLSDTWALLAGTNGSSPLFASATARPSTGVAPLAVNLTVAISGGTGPYSVAWTFGDGSAASNGSSVTHTYRTSGTFSAVAAVTDANAHRAFSSVSIVVITSFQYSHSWSELSAASPAPPARSAGAMAFDPLLGYTVLFGGVNSSWGPLGDTWDYSNGTWSDATTRLPTAPPARWEASFTYDAADGYLLLFGGRNDTQFFNDTWEFNQSGWHPLSPTSAPSARGQAQISYDAADGYVVLFSGGTGNLPAGSGSNWTLVQDTWKFLGGQWTRLAGGGSASPPAIQVAGFTYDPSLSSVLLYGGVPASGADGGCAYLAPETWTFAHGAWTNRSQTNGSSPGAPGGIDAPGMVYDPQLGGVLLFAGTVEYASGCRSNAETWFYQNGTWTNWTGVITGGPPPARQWFPMVYDAGDGYVLLFGGNAYGGSSLADTWRFGNASAPIAVSVSESGSLGHGPLEMTFSARPLGGSGPYTYLWVFGDGSPSATGLAVTHVYAQVGVSEPMLLVRDGLGHSLTVHLPSVIVLAGSPPAPGRAGPAFPLALYSVVAAMLGVIAGAAAWTGSRERRRRTDAEANALLEELSAGTEPEDPNHPSDYGPA
ncbi:MAG TPA: PKD domain-containing protein [Thermoplasmata archaeon]|nr:PKD domain-containing protein [Thermoplasmata archaeon]